MSPRPLHQGQSRGVVFATDVGLHKNFVTVEFDDKTAGSYFMSALELIDK